MIRIWLLPPPFIPLLTGYGVVSVSLPLLFTFWGGNPEPFLVLMTLLLILSLVFIGFRYGVKEGYRQQTVEHQKEQKNSMYSRNYLDLELQALRAQMNPHFFYNCLNAINHLVLKNETETASHYLMKFSKLMRYVLHNDKSNRVLLSRELEALALYLEMEALRFEHTFTYTITLGPQVETDGIQIPTMLIQPYVENAIWHGLLPKEGIGHLSIDWQRIDKQLICVIEDDGIGRHRIATKKNKSMGMEITAHRMALMNERYGKKNTVDVVDLVDASGEACGTRVIISLAI